MSELYLPQAETPYVRRVLLAVELLDAVTLQPVSRTVQVSAPPLTAAPIVNLSRCFVWLDTGSARPVRVIVDPGALPYDRENVAAPDLPAVLLPSTERRLRIWMRPRRGYVFPDGVTVVRGRLDRSAGVPPQAIADAEIWLQWRDDPHGPWQERRARTFTRTGAGGEFSAFLRLPAPVPSLARDKEAPITARVGVHRPGLGERYSAPIDLREGVPDDEAHALIWDELTTT